MKTGDTIIPNRQSAEGYDTQARQTGWFGPEVVFGMAYEYVRPGDRLLDLGIGSGLSSQPFYKAGLRIYGLDGSQEALDVCARKGFASGLKCHDLRQLPLPYPDDFCEVVISVAVLNSFPDLCPLFTEVKRILRPLGTFAFTFESQAAGQSASYPINRREVDQPASEEDAVLLYRHVDEMVAGWLEHTGFMLEKRQEFVAFCYPAEGRNVNFKAYIAWKQA